MKGSGILQAFVVILSATHYFPHCVYAQYGLGSPHILSLEDYDSDEVVPMVRRPQVPETYNFKRNYRSHPTVTNPRVLTPLSTVPLTDDIVKQLQSLLTTNSKKKATKRKFERMSVPEPVEKSTYTVSTPSTPTTTSSTTLSMSTMSTASNRVLETPHDSREIGKKWFPLLLQEAIENVLRKNSSEHDELDELVDQIAAGSGVYRHETNPAERYKESSVPYRNSVDHHRKVENDMVRLNLTIGTGTHLPSLNLWENTDQLGSVPFVVNIFNNTKIGYILMKVCNDSEIRVEPEFLENAYENSTVDDDTDRKVRKVLSGDKTSDEEDEERQTLSTRSHYNERVTKKDTKRDNVKLPHVYKTTPPMLMARGSQTKEPSFFNILKTPDNEEIKYRVLLRNADTQPEKGKARAQHAIPLPKSQHPVKVLTGDRRANHPNGRQGTPKRKPLFYSQEKPTILRNHHPLKELIEVPSVEYEPDTRPPRRHSMGRVMRKYDYESLEEELPLEEPDIIYPDTNTVTQRTAKILASGKHNLPALDSNEKRHRTTPKPYKETQRYNFRRKFGTTDSDTDSNEHPTTPAASNKRDTFNIADLPGDDVLFNQATANVYVKAQKDSRLREVSYRRQQTDSDGSDETLMRSYDTSDGGSNDLFERKADRSKRILKRTDTRWESENSSEEEEDSSSS